MGRVVAAEWAWVVLVLREFGVVSLRALLSGRGLSQRAMLGGRHSWEGRLSPGLLVRLVQR